MLQARLMIDLLSFVNAPEFEVVHCQTLEETLNSLATDELDIVLLDLNLSDSIGYDTFQQIQELSVGIPVILLTATSNEEIALKAIQNGAQDYLIKGEFDGKLLIRSIRYALERHQMQSELRSLSLTDELTGLYNRRGFSTLATQHLKLARRTEQGFFIVFADLDGLKQINDSYGHAKGDAALVETAEILRKTFKDSDILARYGGDEFLILVTDTIHNNREKIYKRFKMRVEECNNSGKLKCPLSVSLGIVSYEPGKETDLDKLIAEADRELYKDKQLNR